MTRNDFEQYYIQQARQSGNGFPIFIGSQRGNGLGGILSGLARMVVPVLKRGGKSLLKETLRTGVGILDDVASGKNLKTSAQKRFKQGGTRLLHQAADSIIPTESGPPGKRIKRKTRVKKNQSTAKRRRVNTSRDIFS